MLISRRICTFFQSELIGDFSYQMGFLKHNVAVIYSNKFKLFEIQIRHYDYGFTSTTMNRFTIRSSFKQQPFFHPVLFLARWTYLWFFFCQNNLANVYCSSHWMVSTNRTEKSLCMSNSLLSS